MKYLILLSMLLLACAVNAQEPILKLQDPGFEEGKGWIISEKEPISSIIADAAKRGKLGLRVVDKSVEVGSGVISERFSVKPGQKVKVEFFARTTDKTFCGVNVVYFAKDKSWTTDSNEKLPGIAVSDPSGKWKKYEFETVIPDWVDQVAVWVHSWSNGVGSADFDDFDLKIK